jgi:hypothetical protein
VLLDVEVDVLVELVVVEVDELVELEVELVVIVFPS